MSQNTQKPNLDNKVNLIHQTILFYFVAQLINYLVTALLFLLCFCCLVFYFFVFAMYLSAVFVDMISMRIDDMANSKHVCGANEFDDFCHIHQLANAKITGVVTQLSPLKHGKTCNYFDGEISDENVSIRFCGFDVGVRRRLVEYFEREEAVSVCNCEV